MLKDACITFLIVSSHNVSLHNVSVHDLRRGICIHHKQWESDKKRSCSFICCTSFPSLAIFVSA